MVVFLFCFVFLIFKLSDKCVLPLFLPLIWKNASIKESVIFYQTFLDYCELWWLGRNKQRSLRRKWLESHWAFSIICLSKWICGCSRSQACPWACGSRTGEWVSGRKAIFRLTGKFLASRWLVSVPCFLCNYVWLTSVASSHFLKHFHLGIPFKSFLESYFMLPVSVRPSLIRIRLKKGDVMHLKSAFKWHIVCWEVVMVRVWFFLNYALNV